MVATSELAHSTGVNDLHPLNGIDIDAQIPAVDFIWVDTRQKGEIAGDHQSLNVMGIGMGK